MEEKKKKRSGALVGFLTAGPLGAVQGYKHPDEFGAGKTRAEMHKDFGSFWDAVLGRKKKKIQ